MELAKVTFIKDKSILSSEFKNNFLIEKFHWISQIDFDGVRRGRRNGERMRRCVGRSRFRPVGVGF